MTISRDVLVLFTAVVVGAALLIFYQHKVCREHIRRLESLNASLATRYIQLAMRFSEKFPEHKDEMVGIVNSLIKLLHDFQDRSFQPAVAVGNVTIGGDVTGRDKEESTNV